MGWEEIIKDESPLERSMGFLQGMADELGIRIEINSPRSVEFKYEGLNYTMSPEGLYIHVGSRYIFVCVVDEKRLPLGDYYASLIGLIVNDPKKIPTLGFGIRLAKILSYRNVPTSYETIYLYTPFGSEEEDVSSFKYLLDSLGAMPYTLGAIKRALVESFGDDRGFF